MHFLGSFVERSRLPIRNAQRVVRFGQVGVQFQGSLQLGFRGFDIVLVLQGDAQIVMRAGQVRLAPDGLAQLFHRLVQVALLDAGKPQS